MGLDMHKTIFVLGEEWIVDTNVSPKVDSRLEEMDGLCDYTVRHIVVTCKEESSDLEDFSSYQIKVLRHEIIHAFLYESGLLHSSSACDSWAVNEEMVDWLAIQFPKITKVFKDLNIL